MHRRGHKLVAECALQTVEHAFGLPIPQGFKRKVLGSIMRPDALNRKARDKIPHRLRSWGEADLLEALAGTVGLLNRAPRLPLGDLPKEEEGRASMSPKHPVRRLALLRGFPDVSSLPSYLQDKLSQHLATALHLVADFCCLDHQPNIRKDRAAESFYEACIDEAAAMRQPAPSIQAIHHLADYAENHLITQATTKTPTSLPARITSLGFLRHHATCHIRREGRTYVSQPADDLEQAIFCASTLCLAAWLDLLDTNPYSTLISKTGDPLPNPTPIGWLRTYRPGPIAKNLALFIMTPLYLATFITTFFAPFYLLILLPLCTWTWLAASRPTKTR